MCTFSPLVNSIDIKWTEMFLCTYILELYKVCNPCDIEYIPVAVSNFTAECGFDLTASACDRNHRSFPWITLWYMYIAYVTVCK